MTCQHCRRRINHHVEAYYSDSPNRRQWCIDCGRLPSEIEQAKTPGAESRGSAQASNLRSHSTSPQ